MTAPETTETNAGKDKEASSAEEPTADQTETTQPTTAKSITDGKVVMVRLDEIDVGDTTFQFRATLRIGDLKTSLKAEGQQIPIVVRRGQGKKKYQIISGFRRTTAAKELGWTEIAAIVRQGLSEEEAFRAAILENTARKTYSDIDRAYVIRSYRERGHGGDEVAKVMNLTDRQVRNLLSLLELPDEVQGAVDDPDQHFSTTHALTLKKLKRKYPKLDFNQWVAMVNQDELSVSQMIRQVNAEHKGEAKKIFKSLFQNKGTDWKKGEVRLAPLKIKVDELSEQERSRLKSELERLMKKLG